jgi:hypothetical protein
MSGDIETRLEELETLVEQQQETIERQRERIEELEGAGTDAAHEHGDTTPGVANDRPDSPADSSGEATAGGIDRRSAMKAGALLSLVGIGAGRAGASPTGQVGTSSRPLKRLYTQRLDGGVTGGQGLTDIAGTNLSIDSNGTLNASAGGGGISSLSGGNGIDPGTIADGDTLTVAWDDAASLDASGDIADFSAAFSLNPVGDIADFSAAASLDASGTVDAGRYLATTSGQVDFVGPAEWENAGDTSTNTVSGGSATVAGGESNEASNLNATVAGGQNNVASGVNSTIGGGEDNEATAGDGTIGGGVSNKTSAGTTLVAGGTNNEARTVGSTVGGGAVNIADASYATVAGGNNNLVTGDYGTIAGGAPQNPPEDSTQNAVYDAYGTIGGGSNNQVGSDDGTANAEYATVPGGRNNTASGAYSTAIGRNATASEDGSFVVGDSTATEITPSFSDEAVFQMPVNTSVSFGFTDNSMFLSSFENADGNDVFTVSVPGTYNPFDILQVIDTGNVNVAGNLAFSGGLQSDTGTNVVINSDNELAVDSSSARHKTDIQPHSTSDSVLDLELRSFQYEETGSEDVGFIAEEVEEHVPEIVTYDDEDRPFGVKYDRIGAHLVPEVRDNRERLGELESDHETEDTATSLETALAARDDRIDELEAENERLREHAATLEDRLDTVESRLDAAQDELPSQGVADD